MKEYWTIKRVATGGRWDRSQWFGKDRAEWVKFTSRAVAYSTLVTFLNKQWEGDEKFRVVHHTVKPRGAKPGTWAWACEQMLAGKTVQRQRGSRIIYRLISDGQYMGYAQCGTERTACPDCLTKRHSVDLFSGDMTATDWAVVPYGDDE